MTRCAFPSVLAVVFAIAIPLSAGELEPTPAGSLQQGWQSLITVEQLHQRLAAPNLLVIDARAAKEYDAGHIPGAINSPGVEWRTPATKVPSPGNLEIIG